MKIAVVGGGISGLLATRLLSRNAEVTLFEEDGRLGGHVNTKSVCLGGISYQVDTGFIVFNQRNYPIFSRLIEELGVASQPTEMSFGVSHEAHGIEFAGRSLDSLFADRRTIFRPDHWRMLADVRRFMATAEDTVSKNPELSLGQFVAEFGYSLAFAERFLYPLAAALWSFPHGMVKDFPLRFVVDFLANHAMLRLKDRPTWRVITGGSKTYVAALTSKLAADIRVGAAIERIVRDSQGIRVEGGGNASTFDEVIVACHADDALGLLSQPTDAERAILGAFRYEPNEAVLHTDTSVMPKHRRAWASWNYRVPKDGHRATVTYDMTRLQSLPTEAAILVSLNETNGIDPAMVFERIQYAHPVASFEAEASKQRRNELLRHEGISYCGAYWGHGFHEDGARSAVEVAQAFGVKD